MTVLKAKIGGVYQAVLSGYASNVFIGPNPPTDPNIEFWVDTDDYLPVVPWIPVTFQNNWVNFGGTYQVAQYRKIGDSVQLRGVVKSGTVGQPMFTLPAGFTNPTNGNLQVAVPANSVYGLLEILTNGIVQLTTGSNAAVSINIQFSVTP